MHTKLDIYRDMHAEVCKSTAPRKIPFLCHVLNNLDRIHNYPQELVTEIHEMLHRMSYLGGPGSAIALPPEVVSWSYNHDDDMWVACMVALRLGVMDQLIADEEAKNVPSNG